ncbi:MAG TPA: hypothetical protein VG055_12830 [Planctomycetaceae bacterium]|jgi:hypothetical protein|nr:hypothetical protein [Planctomycetaceae bacterium]
MNDEPKKRSRAWVWWATLVVLLLAYPLSMPPAMNWTISHGHVGAVYRFYSPVLWVTGRVGVVRRFINWYGAIWDMEFDAID